MENCTCKHKLFSVLTIDFLLLNSKYMRKYYNFIIPIFLLIAVNGAIAQNYSENFESNNGNYVANPISNAWQWGVPTSGPYSAHSGAKVWATILDSNYVDYANWKLHSPIFIAMANNPVLRFWHWYSFEPGYDGGNLKISTDNGVTWILIRPSSGYPGVVGSGNAGIPDESCYTGAGTTWVEDTFNLPLVSGQAFIIRWHFGSDQSVTFPGWYIDDVTGQGFSRVSNDVGIDEIISPLTYHRVGTLMTPIARVKNYGVATQSFPVVCSIIHNGSTAMTSTVNVTSLAPGDTARVVFQTWLPMTTGICSVKMQVNIADQNPTNNRKVRITQIGTDNLVEGFNDLEFPAYGWQAIPLVGSYNWTRKTINYDPPCTPYEGSGMASYPSYDADLGNTARIISPPITVGPIPIACSLKFFMYHDSDYATEPDSIKIEYSTDGTAFTRVAAFNRYRSDLNAWLEHTVYLGTFSGTIYLGILAHSGYGHNTNIDYVRLISPTIGIEENGVLYSPIATALYAPNPNPAIRQAQISFSIAEAQRISLKIYNASGRLIKTLANTYLQQGTYNYIWNGKDEHNRRVAGGIYFYILETPQRNFAMKLILTQ